MLHLAARLAGASSRDELRKTNVDGTHDLIRACIAGGSLKHFVFSSSVAAYQNQFVETEWPIHEAHALRMDADNDLAEYGMSKIGGENLVRHYGKLHGFSHSIMRLALVYGVGDPLVDPMVRDNAPDPGFGGGLAGEQSRQFVHIDDAVESLLRATFQPEAQGLTFNVAGPDVITYRDIGRMTRIAIGQASMADMTPDRSRTWRRYVQQYDMNRAKRHLGFTPRVPFAEGLRQIIEVAHADGGLPRPARDAASSGFGALVVAAGLPAPVVDLRPGVVTVR